MRTLSFAPLSIMIVAFVPGCSREEPKQTNHVKPAPKPAADDWRPPPEIQESIQVERRFAGGDARQQYFRMRQRKPAKAVEKHGLVVILPGGSGSEEFLPFGANVLTAFAIPDEFLVAQLVAHAWREGDDRVVWPSEVFRDKKAEFTTEAFIAAVIDEVSKKEAIDERYVFTLGWSSSGHVLYSASTRVPQVRGSVIAMSRFIPARYIEAGKVKAKAYFLYHSPDDKICPFSEAELAVKTLTKHGAQAKLVSYKGGHGWQPFTFYADRIKEGIMWLKEASMKRAEIE